MSALPQPRATHADRSRHVVDTARTFEWLADDRRPLDWNGPSNRLFTPIRDRDLLRPIAELVEGVACRHHGRIAVRDRTSTLTFGELWDAASGLAERIASETTPGELIGLLLPAGPMFPIAMLACFAAGRPFVALDTHAPPAWLDHALREAPPALILTLERDVPGTEGGTRARRVIRLTAVPKPASPGWRPVPLGIDEPACVLFTSGSTGRPKGIVNSQRNLLQRAAQAINAAHINATDRMLTLAAPSTIVGVRDVTAAMLAGASSHLRDPHGVGAREIAQTVRAEATTILFAFPALLRSVVAAAGTPADDALRLVRIGGDTTLWRDVETLRAWLAPGTAIQVVYAATEAPMLQWFVDDRCRRDDPRVPIGYPLRGTRFAVVDDAGGAVARGDVGQLVVASPYVALGRWGERGLDTDDVEADGGDGSRVFRTGDLVRQRPDGLLERVGRTDRQVKIRGSRVSLEGVEALLRAHPLMRDVAAVARPAGADGTTTLVAYVSVGADARPGLLDELKTVMRSAPAPMRPARFHVVPSIPRLSSSKLDVRALAALDDTHARQERAETINGAGLAPGMDDRVSQVVARAWRQVLDAPVRAAEEDFFDSGGDSLKAIAFAIELERGLGREIPLTLLNEAPRFDQLCRALRADRQREATPLVTLKAGDEAPPIFFIHGAGGNVFKLLPTARRVAYSGAVIGVRARGVVRGEVPHASIEAMAADYLREIKERQPTGPYYLCGYSSGGLVAFEIARRLSESGDAVGLVGLFDTRPSRVQWPLRTWLSVAGHGLAQLAAALHARPIRTLGTAARSLAAPARNRRTVPTAIGVTARAIVAAARYRPGFYRGELTVFSPAGRPSGLPSLESFWRRHARAVVVIETTGNHSTMLSGPHAEGTAACLARCLPA